MLYWKTLWHWSEDQVDKDLGRFGRLAPLPAQPAPSPSDRRRWHLWHRAAQRILPPAASGAATPSAGDGAEDGAANGTATDGVFRGASDGQRSQTSLRNIEKPVLMEKIDVLWSKDEILVTQPRRVSCVSVARRVSEERGEALGHTVGYAIRHEHRGGDASCLTYCTQGVLLRRLESDPELQGITHIFADEVHERSLEGDLLLLLLRELSRRRSSHHSLHIIAMSATFDAHRLQKYFTNGSIQPVVFKLPGKMFPVKTIFLEDALEITKHQPDGPLIPNRRLCLSRYRASTKYSGAPCSQAPKVEDLSNYSVQQRYGHLSTSTRSALAAMDPNHVNFDFAADVVKHFLSQSPPEGPGGPLGAILVFLSGAKEISQMRSALLEAAPELRKEPANSWILNLHSSLQHDEQQLVFRRAPGSVRKIILATNIAETSITIDDVGVVIDTGHVKELRYDSGRRVASLQDVFECRSSALQRRGRAGRVAPGVCVHLVTKYCHNQLMEEHQEPEVCRVPLEELLLRIHAAGRYCMGHKTSEICQALLDPPEETAVQSALNLGLLTPAGAGPRATRATQLSSLGRRALPLPLAPRHAKLALLGCALGPRCREVAVSAAAALNAASWPFQPGAPCSASFDEGRRFEARRVHRAIAEEVSSQLACSDLLGALRAFGEWRAERPAEQRRAAEAWHLRSSALQEIDESRLQLLEMLEPLGRDTRHCGLGGSNGELAPCLAGLLCAASFPQLALAIPKETLSSRMGTGAVLSELFVHEKGTLVPVQVHPSSISAKEKIFGTPFVLYEELIETTRLYVRCITCIPPLTLLLFGGLLSESEQLKSNPLGEEAFLQLGSFKWILPKELSDQILEIRRLLEGFLQAWMLGASELSEDLEKALLEVLRFVTRHESGLNASKGSNKAEKEKADKEDSKKDDNS
ncbi:Putative ATP-dependent RNA helicase DHX57 (DEAH box protein 57) [Durusdinium trenchii]|uniref:ATP-dependent RNA helicase DHX57 (DEAH box protein 57) n=1 Tax=Durusdinium trenchii TaxID=1381693 RepID=A0ABP0S481_9DINO